MQMVGQGTRTALQVYPLYEHKARTSLSSIAIDQAGTSLYLGLTDGQLEEHRVALGPKGVKVSLSARKLVGKKPITVICLLEASRRLALLCDGALTMLDLETLEGQQLAGLKGVTSIAAKGGKAYPPRLAVAVRTSKKAVRVLVYEVLAGADAASPFGSTALCIQQRELPQLVSIKMLVWLDEQIVFCTSLGYTLLDPASGATSELLVLPENALFQTLVQSLPGSKHAVLLMDQVGIVINAAGQPTNSALTFPSGPNALATADIFLLAIDSTGVHVYELASSALVQSLEFPADQRPAPDQQLHAAQNATGTRVLVAGFRKVWLYLPVALEEQAKQLLQAHDYGAALDLAARCASQGAPWAQTAFAEAGFLLLHEVHAEGRIAQAVAAFSRCDTSLLQPMELFPLFPGVTQHWASQLPRKKYWGLHPPVADLRSLAAKHSPEASSSGRQTSSHNLLAEGRIAVADYLLQVREREGVECMDGIDTLIVHLLAASGRGPDLEAFAARPNRAELAVVEAQLQEAGQQHVLAQLYAAGGRPGEALATWQSIADSVAGMANGGSSRQHAEASTSGRAREAAVRCVAELLADERRVDGPLALQYLAWLLEISPDQALAVITGRHLDQSEVLALLRRRGGEAAWRYLEHLVWERGSQDPARHTELALLLTASALRLMPPPDLSKPAWQRAQRKGEAGDANGPSLSGKLHEVREKLQRLLEHSQLYDKGTLLHRLADTDLFEEQVILHSKVGDHLAALRGLGLVLGDIHRAEAYCRKLGSQEAYLGLLDLLLHPADGREPLYADACHLLAAQGANLDPMRVLEALSEEMPIALAVETLSRMLRERIHRHRQGLILRNLHRSVNLSASAERAEVMSKRVVVEDERACRVCHTRISNKMFAVYPNGVLVCYKCFSKHDPHICPLTGTNFNSPTGKKYSVEN